MPGRKPARGHATAAAAAVTACFIGCTLALQALTAEAAFCDGKPDPKATGNSNPISTHAPVLVRSVPNASLYHAGDGDDTVSIVHIWGDDAYARGHAQGLLMKDEATEFINRAYGYFESQFVGALNKSVPWIPPAMAKWVADVGLGVALDLTYDATKSFSGEYFFQEMQGLADATGVDYKTIRRVHMIGELTKGSCSMYGAWDTATEDGKTLQMRALDWDTTGPFQDYPQVTIYHSSSADSAAGNTFANVGWTGWLGSITGMSAASTAISEIGVSFPDASFGKESRFGVPFTFILRDILQFDTSLAQAQHRISTANRTCDLILGVGDGKIDTSTGAAPFRGIQYSHSVANFYDDQDMMPRNDSWHARIKDIVYYGMDWLCPAFSRVLHDRLVANIPLTPEKTIHEVLPIVQTGDLHIAVYDLTDGVMYVANARGGNETGPLNAYDRNFVQLDMKTLFAAAPPTQTRVL